MNTPPLRTKRLLLRKFTENDLEVLYQIFSDEEVNTFLPWFPLAAGARAFYEEHFASKYCQPCSYSYAVCRKKDNIPIGYVTAETCAKAGRGPSKNTGTILPFISWKPVYSRSFRPVGGGYERRPHAGLSPKTG